MTETAEKPYLLVPDIPYLWQLLFVACDLCSSYKGVPPGGITDNEAETFENMFFFTWRTFMVLYRQ